MHTFAAIASAGPLVLSTLTTPSTPTASAPDGVSDASETYIEGGHIQGYDPTRYDYAPPSPQASLRSAWGHQTIGGFTFGFKGLSPTIPRGTLAHDIQGGSTYIRQEAARYLLLASANICNYRIDFQNRGLDGTIWGTDRGATENSCAWRLSATRELNVPRHVRPGYQCARLFVGGIFRGEQCRNIVR